MSVLLSCIFTLIIKTELFTATSFIVNTETSVLLRMDILKYSRQI